MENQLCDIKVDYKKMSIIMLENIYAHHRSSNVKTSNHFAPGIKDMALTYFRIKKDIKCVTLNHPVGFLTVYQ